MVSEASTSQPGTSLQLDVTTGMLTDNFYHPLQLDATTGMLTPNFYHPSSSGGERAERSKIDERGSLLPIFPDDFTINLILPKLPWRVLVKLTQLNRAWRAAVRSPEVYDVRARASTSQTIVTIGRRDRIISLYDTATETWHALPRPPFDHMHVAPSCCCVTMCGKLYILGGSGLRNKVIVFEFAGQGCWKDCASMKSGRKNFACAVHGGKIYVFGGIGAGSAAEVYDPEQDLWCDIAPMLTHRIKHKVVTIGDILCIYMGWLRKSSNNDRPRWDYAHCAEIYDPQRDRWTAVANFTIDGPPKSMEPRPIAEVAEDAFVKDGKLHGILDDWLYVYEPSSVGIDSKALNWDGTGSWKAVQSISWGVFQVPGTVNYVNRSAWRALVVPSGGELFALVFGPTGSVNNYRRWIFLKSEGLGCADRKLSWKRVEGSTRSTLGTHEESHVEFSRCIASIAGPW